MLPFLSLLSLTSQSKIFPSNSLIIFVLYFLYAWFFYFFTELPLPSSWFLDQTISFRLGILKIILLINFISNQTWVLLTVFFLFPYILILILNFVCIKLISFKLLPTMLRSVLLLLNANVEKVESTPPFNIVASSICLADVQVLFSILQLSKLNSNICWFQDCLVSVFATSTQIQFFIYSCLIYFSNLCLGLGEPLLFTTSNQKQIDVMSVVGILPDSF